MNSEIPKSMSDRSDDHDSSSSIWIEPGHISKAFTIALSGAVLEFGAPFHIVADHMWIVSKIDIYNTENANPRLEIGSLRGALECLQEIVEGHRDATHKDLYYLGILLEAISRNVCGE